MTKRKNNLNEETPGRPGLMRSSKVLTPVAVAELTGLSTETLAQWRSQRRGIPFLKLSRNVVRYRLCDVEQWLAEHLVSVEADVPVRTVKA